MNLTGTTFYRTGEFSVRASDDMVPTFGKQEKRGNEDGSHEPNKTKERRTGLS